MTSALAPCYAGRDYFFRLMGSRISRSMAMMFLGPGGGGDFAAEATDEKRRGSVTKPLGHV